MRVDGSGAWSLGVWGGALKGLLRGLFRSFRALFQAN